MQDAIFLAHHSESVEKISSKSTSIMSRKTEVIDGYSCHWVFNPACDNILDLLTERQDTAQPIRPSFFNPSAAGTIVQHPPGTSSVSQPSSAALFPSPRPRLTLFLSSNGCFQNPSSLPSHSSPSPSSPSSISSGECIYSPLL